jgi:hypothetical protein
MVSSFLDPGPALPPSPSQLVPASLASQQRMQEVVAKISAAVCEAVPALESQALRFVLTIVWSPSTHPRAGNSQLQHSVLVPKQLLHHRDSSEMSFATAKCDGH